MKNFKLNRTPIDIGVMKKHLFLKSLLIAIGLLVTGLTTQAWADHIYWFAGDNPGWSTTAYPMNVSADGYYEYYQVSGSASSNYNCKIITTYNSWDGALGYAYTFSGFNGTNITNMNSSSSSWDTDNFRIWCASATTFYILAYYPSTTINSSTNVKLCAATFLPDNRSCTTYFVDSQDWGGTLKAYEWYSGNGDGSDVNNASWPGANMTSTGYTYNGKTIYKYTHASKTFQNVIFTNQTDGSYQTADLVLYDQTVPTDNRGKMYVNTASSPAWAALQYDVALDRQSGTTGDESVIATVGSAMPSATMPTRTGYTFGGYFTSTGGSGTKYYNADGTSAHTMAADGPKKLYAKWTENMSSVSLVASPTGKGSFTIGGAAATSTSAGVTTTRSVTAVPIDGYHFVSWSITGGATISSTTTNPTTVTGGGAGTAATLTATFAADDVYTLTVAAGTGISSVSGSTNDIKAGNNIAISATVATGYTWSNWTKTGAGTLSTFTAGTKDQTVTIGTAGDITLTASATEDKVTLVPTVSYDHGSSNYTATSSNTLGVATSTTLTASTPNAEHYTFAGWTLTNLTVTDGDASTDRSITVKITTPGSPIAAVANYNEVLTSRWHLVGTDVASKVTYPNGWTVDESSMMQKATGHSTESVVYANVTVSNADGTYEFKVVDDNGASDDIWYGYSTGETYLTWTETSTKDVYTGDGNGNNLKFTPTVAGTYVFKVDYSGTYPAVTVTFPTSYTLTYAIGSVAGNYGSVSTSPSTASGSKVLSGSNITLTAPEPATGYSWSGWYTNAAGTEGNIADEDRAITVTMDADKTLYACYTENSNTVTVNVNGGGKISYNSGEASTSVNASAGVNTFSATISAIPDDGYAFVGWTGVNAGNHITNYDNVGGDEGWNSTNEGFDIQVKADAATTITANFQPRFALMGSLTTGDANTGGMPGWSTPAYATYSDETYTVSCDLTNPNSPYKFKIIDLRHKSWVYRGYSSDENNLAVDNTTTYTLNSETSDVYFDSKGVGTYTFTIVEEEISSVVYPKVKIQDGANSHMITWGYVSDNGQEGGTITSVVDGEATPNAIASGKYVKDGGSITATASANTGYRFVDFRTGSTYGEGSQLGTSTTYTVASVTADQDIYAHFAENLCTVTITANNTAAGTITVGGEAFAWGNTTQVGVYNYKSLVVTPAEGYYFSGWTLSNTPDFAVDDEGESGRSTDLRGLGGTHGSTGTLTANFVELDKIYFRNLSTMDDGAWDNVYVYFGVTWNGYANAVTNASASYKATMTQIGETDVYWAYVPRAFTTSGGTAIAFADYSVGTSATINTAGKLAASRNDYNRALQMYVPSVTWDDHGAHYYNSGYWRCYPVKAAIGAGYYLQTTRGTNLVEFTGQADNSDIIECTVRVDQHDEDKTFHIKSAGGIYFEQYDYDEATYPKITSTASTMTMKGDDSDGLTVTLTSEGDYKFIIDQSGDVMELTVLFPIGVGDYRLKHTYNSGAKTVYSDVIKASTADEAATYSMFLSKVGAPTLVLQKCTLINTTTKLPEWSAGDDTNLSDILNTVNTSGDGVYQFDLTVDNSNHKVATVDNIGKYDGPFYIKTDCSTGKWANYRENVMTVNTITADQFDYYFVTNAAALKNVKFVIANKYCNAISDTIVADNTYLVDGEGGTSGSREFTPEACCVRFGYKSSTNTASRAYMRYSSNDNFLNIKPTAASEVYLESGGSTDLYSGTDANTKISGDDGNYVYRKTVYAVPGATANIQATFNGSVQTFVSSRTLMAGTGSDKYPISVVYDFKTNHLMAAWQPSSGVAITAALENVEFMYIREGQENANQISFSGDGEFTNPKAYGVFQFDQADYKNMVGTWNSYTYSKCMFYFSFPFNVKVSDIYGVGTYGTEWKIQYYDGAERASKGFFRGDGTTTFWKDMPLDGTLEAYVGYSLLLDNDYFNGDLGTIWDMNPTSVYLYFPSKESISEVSEGEIKITVPAHECTIDRTFDNGSGTMVSHRKTDSHWNMLGVPLFRNQSGNFSSTFKSEYDEENPFGYLYAWDASTNTLGITDASAFTFKAMYAYMVQYTGTITFTGSRIPNSVAARRAPQEGNYKIDLSVLDGEEAQINHTYVELREDASEDFMLNEDVYMSLNSRDVNIYSFAGDYDVAANVLPMANQTVRLGMSVKKNGTYKLSMPSSFNGTATLIDTETNQRTNLGFGDYEVYLTKGNYNNRFLLEINIYKTPTAIDGVDGGSLKDGKAHKFIENGQMFILRDGRIYDATGVLVK